MVHLKFIECVATFVDKAKDRGFEVLGLVSSGYSHIISCDPRREGVDRNVQPESVHRHTQQRQKFLIHLLHRWYIIVNIFQRKLLRKCSFGKGLCKNYLGLRDQLAENLVEIRSS